MSAPVLSSKDIRIRKKAFINLVFKVQRETNSTEGGGEEKLKMVLICRRCEVQHHHIVLSCRRCEVQHHHRDKLRTDGIVL